jgi:signal transduction histidine kinase
VSRGDGDRDAGGDDDRNDGGDPRLDDVHHILGAAAHELKNALAPLVMTLQICERRALAGEPVAHDDLAFARAQTRRISQLVNDLLDSARIDSGQFPLRLAPLDLCALVQSTVDAFRRSNPRRVVCDVPPLPLMHIADGERLAALLTNFLDNAAKYAPEPSPIEVRMSQAGQRIRIAVTDHGPGIRPDDRKRLFQRYFRGRETAETTRGLGLGLYLCQAIADRHGGAVGVDSAPGKGATFWLDLSLGQT